MDRRGRRKVPVGSIAAAHWCPVRGLIIPSKEAQHFSSRCRPTSAILAAEDYLTAARPVRLLDHPGAHTPSGRGESCRRLFDVEIPFGRLTNLVDGEAAYCPPGSRGEGAEEAAFVQPMHSLRRARASSQEWRLEIQEPATGVAVVARCRFPGPPGG